MTKTKKLLLLIAVIGVMVFAFMGCQSFKWGPVGTTEYSSEEAQGNGTYAVKQGGYLYYVNGYYPASNLSQPKDNYFGKASVKGSVMKSKINDDGSLTDTAVVVPKAVINTSTMGGIYVIGSWIYYATPTTLTDNKDVLLSTTFEYYRTKTDGTDTQKIATLDGAALNFKFTEYGFIYSLNNTISMVAYNNDKIGDTTTVAEEVSNVIFTTTSNYKAGETYLTDYIFFTKVSESDTFYGNLLYATNGLNTVKITDEETYSAGTNISLQYSFAPLRAVLESDGLALYYTRASYTGGSTSTVGTFGYKFASAEFTFTPANEKQFATTALSTFTPISYADGLLDTSAAATKLYNGISASPKTITFSAAPTILFTQGSDTYYLISNKLMKRDILNDGIEVKVSEESMDTTWLRPSIINNYVYYINSSVTNYLFRINLNDFTYDANNIVLPEGKIVSGYVDNDKTEDGLAPAFMTEDDLKTYVSNNAKEK